MIAVMLDQKVPLPEKRRVQVRLDYDAQVGKPFDSNALEVLFEYGFQFGHISGLLESLSYMNCCDASFSIAVSGGTATMAGSILVSSAVHRDNVSGLLAVVEKASADFAKSHPGSVLKITGDLVVS